MERQNVTLSIPKPLLKQAKILAAQEDKSLSEVIREALAGRVENQSRYHKARQRHTSLLRRGLNLGTQGQPMISREDLHERR